MIAIMPPDHVARLLAHAERDVRLADGRRVFGTGEAVRFLFVVREGGVRMLRRQRDGSVLVLQRARPGELVAEASVFAPRYHCEAVAEGPTVLARIPKAAVSEHLLADAGWLGAFAAHLASEVQRTRGRAELLSLKRVGERVDAWLALNGGAAPDRGGWADWANELGVSPEALYRELARRREPPSRS
jgi:CRP-like cAMP-binding protein